MKPPYFKRPGNEIGEIPKELEPHFSAINYQVEQLTNNLQGQVSERDNSNANEISFLAKDGTEYTLKTGVRGKASKVRVDWTSHCSPWRLCWRVVDMTTIAVTVKWDSAPTSAATVKITVLGD
jgi:hypothetical protein